MQKLSIVVYKAGPLAVLYQFITQPLRIISVFLDCFCFDFHLCLLVEAVVGEAAVSGGGFLLYDTTLTVICKIIYAVRILFLEKLVFLVVAVSAFFFAFCFLDSVFGGVLGITDSDTVSAFFQKLSSDIILVADVKSAASCGQSLYSCLGSAVSVAVILVIKGQQDGAFRFRFQMADVTIIVIRVIRPASCVTLSMISTPGWSRRIFFKICS